MAANPGPRVATMYKVHVVVGTCTFNEGLNVNAAASRRRCTQAYDAVHNIWLYKHPPPRISWRFAAAGTRTLGHCVYLVPREDRRKAGKK